MTNNKDKNLEVVITLDTIEEMFSEDERDKYRYKIASIPAECKNCGYKDIVRAFLVEQGVFSSFDYDYISPVDHSHYRRFLRCPKCGSSYIVTKKALKSLLKL